MTLPVTKVNQGLTVEFRIADHVENPVLVLPFSKFPTGAAMRAAVNKWAKEYGAALED